MAVALVVGRWFPQRVRPWLAVVAAVIAGLVAASRALLGVHWVTDVVAGLVVGWTWFLLVAVIFGGRLQRFGEPFEFKCDLLLYDVTSNYLEGDVENCEITKLGLFT